MTAHVIRGNALNLQPMPNGCVDLVVTSPPYFGLRSYQDGGEHYAGQIGAEATPDDFVDALIAATREMVRVLKPSGSIWVNLGDKYAGAPSGPRQGMPDGATRKAEAHIFQTRHKKDSGVPTKSLIGIPWRYAIRCIDELSLILRAEVIWSKPNGLPESVTDRVRRSHETWFHFTKSPRYFAAVDEVREPHLYGKPNGRAPNRRQSEAFAAAGQTPHGSLSDPNVNPLGKLPGSVWTIPTQPLKVPAELGIDHFAAFPMEWPRRIISGWCPAGGLVLDPFGGTGTTALMADVMGRDAISVDLSEDYCRLANWRINDPKQRVKAREKVDAGARPSTPEETPDTEQDPA